MRNSTILTYNERGGVDFIVSLEATDRFEKTETGLYIRHNANALLAQITYESIVSAFHDKQLVFLGTQVKEKARLPGTGGFGPAATPKQFNVVGSRFNEKKHLICSEPLSELESKIIAILDTSKSEHKISLTESQGAKNAISGIILSYKEGKLQDTLSNSVAQAVKTHTGSKLGATTIENIRILARDFELDSSLFLKDGDGFIKSVTVGIANLNNPHESQLVKCQVAVANFAEGIKNAVERMLGLG